MSASAVFSAAELTALPRITFVYFPEDGIPVRCATNHRSPSSALRRCPRRLSASRTCILAVDSSSGWWEESWAGPRD